MLVSLLRVCQLLAEEPGVPATAPTLLAYLCLSAGQLPAALRAIEAEAGEAAPQPPPVTACREAVILLHLIALELRTNGAPRAGAAVPPDAPATRVALPALAALLDRTGAAVSDARVEVEARGGEATTSDGNLPAASPFVSAALQVRLGCAVPVLLRRAVLTSVLQVLHAVVALGEGSGACENVPAALALQHGLAATLIDWLRALRPVRRTQAPPVAVSEVSFLPVASRGTPTWNPAWGLHE